MEMKVYFPGAKKVNADYKGFTIETDQTKDEGGTEVRPNPIAYFLLPSVRVPVSTSSISVKKGVLIHQT
jgi:hypothetical protein